MADESYKLAKFQDAVFAEINLKTAQIKQEAEEYKEQELKKSKEKQLDESYHLIQDKSEEIKQEFKREVAKFSLDAKRDLLLKRNEITSKIFDNIRVKLSNFTTTDDYKTYLLDAIKEFSNKQISDINIMVNTNDMAFEKEIRKTYALPCNVIENNDILLGGFVACDQQRNIYFDETLEQKLQDQKTYFIEHSNFDI